MQFSIGVQVYIDLKLVRFILIMYNKNMIVTYLVLFKILGHILTQHLKMGKRGIPIS